MEEIRVKMIRKTKVNFDTYDQRGLSRQTILLSLMQ